MTTFRLQNEALSLEYDRETGALVHLRTRQSSWDIINRPHLGLSFQLLVPLPDRRDNPVYGEKQKLTSLEVADDGRSATFVWDGVISEFGGAIDIKLTLKVTLAEGQAVYATAIENRSGYTVESASCPYLGDVQRPSDADWLKTFVYNYATSVETSLWPEFTNLRGYFGSDYPVQYFPGAPMSPYILLRSPDQGLYVGVDEPSAELVAWQCELRPGYGSSIDQRVPETSALAGKDVSTRFAAVHVPYIQPGETRKLTPIRIQPFQGGWQRGVDIYKSWRQTWMKTPELPDWVKEPHAWQQIHINSPEDELRLPYRDLVVIGEDCARHGVKAIQLTGWTLGGQDRDNPSHDIDPRLGAFEELKDAIAEVQELGVKVILFSKFTWADRSTERFRDELVRYAVKDPYGDYYQYHGYQYQTATQFLDINTRRLIPMCFLSEDYLRICEVEFQKTLDLGADGILFDECLHHGPSLLCFDESHGHRPGAPVYANDRVLIQRFEKMAVAQGKADFLFAGEACYDWEFEFYQFSYHRSESKTHVPLSRYMLPQIPLATAVTGFDDRNMINQCLMYRYAISYEPYNFKGRLDDYPDTMAYGKQMDALRTELRGYFWDGEFCDEIGAAVTVDGQPHHPYSVFVNRENGMKGVVVCNYDDSESITAQVVLSDGRQLGRYRLVDNPEWRATADRIVIPSRSAAVVIE